MQNASKQVNEKQKPISSFLSNKNKEIKQVTKSTLCKRDSSQLSPPQQINPKKANMETETPPDPLRGNSTTCMNSPVPISSRVLKDLVGPIVQEVRELKESVHLDNDKLYNNYSKLEGSYSKLKGIITSQQQVISKLERTISTKQKEVTDNLMLKIEEHFSNIRAYIKENKRLYVENVELKERLNKIQLSQLGNNVIISGMQEQPWENYSTTKE